MRRPPEALYVTVCPLLDRYVLTDREEKPLTAREIDVLLRHEVLTVAERHERVYFAYYLRTTGVVKQGSGKRAYMMDSRSDGLTRKDSLPEGSWSFGIALARFIEDHPEFDHVDIMVVVVMRMVGMAAEREQRW